MVDGTGLENQRVKAPQVRILSFPPKQTQKSLLFWDCFEGKVLDGLSCPFRQLKVSKTIRI